jgi:hypothetical protein
MLVVQNNPLGFRRTEFDHRFSIVTAVYQFTRVTQRQQCRSLPWHFVGAGVGRAIAGGLGELAQQPDEAP